MEKLILAGTNDTPEVKFNKESGILFLGGSSLPENVLEVYQPLVDWLDKYITDPNPHTRIEFYFDYLNTASSHMIMQLMERFLALKDACNEFRMIWYYDKTDLDMRDFGEELAELTNYPIELVGKESYM